MEDDDEREKGDENADDDGDKENEPALAKKKKQDPCDKVKKKKKIEKEDPLVTIMGESLQLMESMAEDSLKNQELFKALLETF